MYSWVLSEVLYLLWCLYSGPRLMSVFILRSVFTMGSLFGVLSGLCIYSRAHTYLGDLLCGLSLFKEPCLWSVVMFGTRI